MLSTRSGRTRRMRERKGIGRGAGGERNGSGRSSSDGCMLGTHCRPDKARLGAGRERKGSGRGAEREREGIVMGV
eukprot:364946-Chlamydomonas_euryale.AAC.4